MCPETSRDVTRRNFLHTSMAGAAALAVTGPDGLLAPGDQDAVVAEIAKQHDATVQMLRDWIALPSIAAENRNYPQGAEYMARLARDAGFGRVDLIPTKGKPGVFATLDTGAATTLALYFMYDVKQFDPSEWSSPPLEGRIVDRPGVGQDHDRPRRHEHQGSADRVPRGAARLQGSGTEAAGQPRARLRRRGGNRIAQLLRRRVQAGGRSGAAQVRRHHHPAGQPGTRRLGPGQSRRQGHHRARDRLVGREMGPRADARHPLELRSADRQPGLAPRAGAPHARQGRRPHAGGRGLLRQGSPAQPAAASEILEAGDSTPQTRPRPRRR